MEAYNKLLALCLTSDAPGAATCHVEHFRDLEGQVNLDDNELVIDLFQGSLQEKFKQNPPVKRWEWYREAEEIDWQRMLLQQSTARHPSAVSPHPNSGAQPTPPAQSSFPARLPVQAFPACLLVQATPGNPNRPTNRLLPHQFVQGLRQKSPAMTNNSDCHLCRGTGHWARDCPNKKQSDLMAPRPMQPKVMVTTEDLLEEGALDSGDKKMDDPEVVDPDNLDFSQYQPPMVTSHEEVQDNNKGNVSGAMH